MTLLNDLERTARDRVPFYQTETGSALEHQEAALVGEDVCTVRTVRVGGLEATSIYAEFQTDAPFETVAAWIDPRSWPDRGPMLFKRMAVVDAAEPVALGPPGSPHWHGVFHEEVQLLQRVNTLLHCDFWREGNEAAGMTYDLSLSLDNQIDVDRGFLLVTNAGGDLTVKALKIVGFRFDVWDTVAGWVCPSWTDFVRAAAEGGTSTSASPGPGTGRYGPSGRSPLGETFDAWVELLGDSARAYVDLFEDVTTRVSTRGVSAAECLDDERKLWSRLAQDWAQAWTHGMSTLEEVSREGLDAGLMPPGVPPDRGRGAARTMTSGAPGGPPGEAPPRDDHPGSGLGPSERPGLRSLCIEAGGAVIRAGAIRVGVEQVAERQYGVRLDVTDPSAAAGLYLGRAEEGGRDHANPGPALRLPSHWGVTRDRISRPRGDRGSRGCSNGFSTAAETSLAAGELEPARATAEEVRAVDPGEPAGRRASCGSVAARQRARRGSGP